MGPEPDVVLCKKVEAFYDLRLKNKLNWEVFKAFESSEARLWSTVQRNHSTEDNWPLFSWFFRLTLRRDFASVRLIVWTIVKHFRRSTCWWVFGFFKSWFSSTTLFFATFIFPAVLVWRRSIPPCDFFSFGAAVRGSSSATCAHRKQAVRQTVTLIFTNVTCTLTLSTYDSAILLVWFASRWSSILSFVFRSWCHSYSAYFCKETF